MKNALFLIAFCAVVQSVSAANVQIQVIDRDGKPVPEAVVVVYPASGGAPPAAPSTGATIEQERMRFLPAVTVVTPGTSVRFVNRDRWDHHVRGAPAGLAAATSSAAAAGVGDGFELRLAGKSAGKDDSSSEVRMDTAGVLLLSCHLHGSMRGHVFVTDSVYTVKTDTDGIARFVNVPDGGAQVRVWHAEQLIDLPRKAVQLSSSQVNETVQLSVVPRVRRAPPGAAPARSTSPGGYGSSNGYSSQ